jgi:hypothetical protein
MTMDHFWPWLTVGLFPYLIKQQQGENMQTVEVYAPYWSLAIYKSENTSSWTVCIPLIEYLQQRLLRDAAVSRRKNYVPRIE